MGLKIDDRLRRLRGDPTAHKFAFQQPKLARNNNPITGSNYRRVGSDWFRAA